MRSIIQLQSLQVYAPPTAPGEKLRYLGVMYVNNNMIIIIRCVGGGVLDEKKKNMKCTYICVCVCVCACVCACVCCNCAQ